MLVSIPPYMSIDRFVGTFKSALIIFDRLAKDVYKRQVLVLQCISSGLNIAGLDTNLSTVITGLLLIGVLAVNFISGIFAEKKKLVKKTD